MSHADKPARIVDVGAKQISDREATAEATITMSPAACERVLTVSPKGNPVEAARIAALQAIKRTPELLPFCHPVAVTGAEVTVEADAATGAIRVRVTVRATDRTGVEMEALTGAAVGALCLYDTAKAEDRAAVIGDVRLIAKSGGRSGSYRAPDGN